MHRCFCPPVPGTGNGYRGGSSHPRSLCKALVGWYCHRLPRASQFWASWCFAGPRAPLFVHFLGRGRCCLPLAALTAFALVTKNGWKNERLRKNGLKVGWRGKKQPPRQHQAARMYNCLYSQPLFFCISNTKSVTSPTSASAAADVAPFKICRRRGKKVGQRYSQLHPQLHRLGWRRGGGSLAFPFCASEALKPDAARYGASQRLMLLGAAHGKARIPRGDKLRSGASRKRRNVIKSPITSVRVKAGRRLSISRWP